MMKKLLFLLIIVSAGSLGARELAEGKTAQAELFIKHQYYLGGKNQTGRLKNYFSTGVQIDAYKKYHHWFYDIKSKIQISPLFHTDHFTSLSVANIGYEVDLKSNKYISQIRAAVGRIDNKWSWMDDHWQLGLWRVRNSIDFLDPEALGTMGLMLSAKGWKWTLSYLIGGIYLPDQPQVSGNLHSSLARQSRWKLPIQTHASLTGDPSRGISMKYNVSEFSIFSVLFKTNSLTHLLLGDRETEWLSIGYAYKPLNQLAFRFSPEFSLKGVAVRSESQPFVLIHHIYSIEAGKKYEGWTIKAGVNGEILKEESLPPLWGAPYIETGVFFSFLLSKRLPVSFAESDFGFSILYSRLRTEQIGDSNLYTSITIPNLLRFVISEGIGVDWRIAKRIYKNQKLEFELKYKYSFEQQGSWLMSQMNYYFKNRSYVYVRADILGSLSDEITGYLSQFGYNDRIILGIRHGF